MKMHLNLATRDIDASVGSGQHDLLHLT